MTPLEILIITGKADNTIIEHINELERIKARHDGGTGLSPGEARTLKILYERLDALTS